MSQEEKTPVLDWLDRRAGELGVALAVITLMVIALGGAALLVWQVWVWLRTGIWQAYSCLDLLLAVASRDGKLVDWITSPTDWIGLHRVLGWLPISGTLLGVAIGVFYTWIGILDSDGDSDGGDD